jgi:hypothetical protein
MAFCSRGAVQTGLALMRLQVEKEEFKKIPTDRPKGQASFKEGIEHG